MKQSAFAGFHPGVNFVFFLGAIGFGVVLQHPAYLAAGLASSLIYYLLLKEMIEIFSFYGIICHIKQSTSLEWAAPLV